jgi:hypothetical protein
MDKADFIEVMAKGMAVLESFDTVALLIGDSVQQMF